MAYPTVNYTPVTPMAGTQQITTTNTSQKHALGTRVRAVDGTYGESEFVYLKGATGTLPGVLVSYDQTAGTTSLGVHSGASSKGPVAVAMSANIANQFGWYCVSGSVPVVSGTVAANTRPYMTGTAGTLGTTVVAADAIDGAVIKTADSGGYATIQLDRPSINGNG